MEEALIDAARAEQVLREIDLILAWKKELEQKVEERMMRLCLDLLEVHHNKYWKIRGFDDETEYIEFVFPQSRRQYYKLIEIGTTLGHYDHKILEQIGPTKCGDLVKVHKRFGAVPYNYFAHALEEDTSAFHERVKSAVNRDVTDKRNSTEAVTFETLAFVGDQYFDFTEALRVVKMETGIEKNTEAICMILRDFLSGYRDDGQGRLQNRNAFLLGVIRRCYSQIDRGQKGIYDRLVSQLATWVEEGRDDGGTKMEKAQDQTLED